MSDTADFHTWLTKEPYQFHLNYRSLTKAISRLSPCMKVFPRIRHPALVQMCQHGRRCMLTLADLYVAPQEVQKLNHLNAVVFIEIIFF